MIAAGACVCAAQSARQRNIRSYKTMNDANGMKPNVAPIYSRLGALESYSASKSALQNFVDDKSTHMASNGTMFVSEKTRRGVLPQMLEEILNTRHLLVRRTRFCFVVCLFFLSSFPLSYNWL